LMKMMILDTGVGNIYSLLTMLKSLAVDVEISLKASSIIGSDAVIIPGVGSFDGAMRRTELIKELLIEEVSRGKPLLGICVGYQIMFDSSEEGVVRGLSLMRGRVARLPRTVKVPHMGWNTLEILRPSRLVEGVESGSHVYFMHSYYPILEEDIAVARTVYGVEIPSIAEKGSIYGLQFHPERSGAIGRRLLENFVEVVRR